ncbi:major tail protein [Alkalibacillus salilacus]|uniref:Phi13 family phage major tail protein n=1 Tax=Alkalibacillus salilacus TaxID=284582 RepID=A0ABT9VDL5_9BACI|nr:major tail protein [Alkalibacillus salilacus]MDQ0158960.1 phi13 family phage major tail protein [Alkalibacillus salilacus]
MPTYGLKDLHYAVIESEDDSSTTYTEPKKIAPAINVTISRSVNRANLRGDNQVLFSESAKGPATVSINTTDLPKEVEAELLGKEVADNGVLLEGDEDKAPYVAIGFKADDARGGHKFVWVYRIKFGVGESTFETKQETPTFQTPTIEGESIARLDNGKREAVLWDGDENVTDETIFDEWFNEVIDESWAPAA